MQPRRRLSLRGNSGYLLWRLCERKVPKHVGFAQTRFGFPGEFHRKKALVNYVAEAIHNAGTVKVDS